MPTPIEIKQLNHYNIHAPVELLERVRNFYTEVIGLREGPLPMKPQFPAYWLYLGEQPVLHLNGQPIDPPPADLSPKSTGWLDHIAFSCNDHGAARARLDELGVPYVSNVFPQAGIAQLVLHDPVGIKIELNFMGEKTLA